MKPGQVAGKNILQQIGHILLGRIQNLLRISSDAQIIIRHLFILIILREGRLFSPETDKFLKTERKYSTDDLPARQFSRLPFNQRRRGTGAEYFERLQVIEALEFRLPLRAFLNFIEEQIQFEMPDRIG